MRTSKIDEMGLAPMVREMDAENATLREIRDAIHASGAVSIDVRNVGRWLRANGGANRTRGRRPEQSRTNGAVKAAEIRRVKCELVETRKRRVAGCDESAEYFVTAMKNAVEALRQIGCHAETPTSLKVTAWKIVGEVASEGYEMAVDLIEEKRKVTTEGDAGDCEILEA